MPRHLLLRLEAPIMAFGAPTIDAFGRAQDWPARSTLAGLLANAMGWDRTEADRLDRLQGRLVFGCRFDRPGRRFTEFQTARLGKDDRGWTTRGEPEGRGGGPETYNSPHLRYREHDADACLCVAMRLEPADEAPLLSDLEAALVSPARPLFIGRKPCLPAAPILAGSIEAENILDALRRAGPVASHPQAATLPGRLEVVIPLGEGEPSTARDILTTTRRDHRAGVHVGQERLRRASIQLTPEKPEAP